MMDRVDTLLSEWLDGELDAAGRQELAAMANADPAIAERLRRLYRQHRGLAAVFAQADEDTFTRRILADIAAPADTNQAEVNIPEAELIPAPLRTSRRLRPMPARRSSRAFAWFATAAALVAAVGGYLVLAERGGPVDDRRIADVSGTGAVWSAHGQALLERLPTKGGIVVDGDRVVTGTGASARVRYLDGTTIDLTADSTVLLTMADGKRVRLVSGGLRAEVSPQPRPMEFTSDHATATVLGTRLSLSTSADITKLSVDEGQVRFTRADGSSHMIVAGGSAEAKAPPPPPPPAAPAPPQVIEVENFTSILGLIGRATGPTKSAFIEGLPTTAPRDTAIAVPGVGTTISHRLDLTAGDWIAWVRWRDDTQKTKRVSFEIVIDGKIAATVRGAGTSATWKWSKAAFSSTGRSEIALRSTFAGVLAPASRKATPEHPYDVVNRFDRIVLTRDKAYVPPP
jgi:hypothetical protein